MSPLVPHAPEQLHAHLSGSIRRSTLLELAKAQGVSTRVLEFDSSHTRTLSECFEIFEIIHKSISSVEVLKRVTREVIIDFHEDNVKYLGEFVAHIAASLRLFLANVLAFSLLSLTFSLPRAFRAQNDPPGVGRRYKRTRIRGKVIVPVYAPSTYYIALCYLAKVGHRRNGFEADLS